MVNTNAGLSYRVNGEGKIIVFLHGFLESSSIWTEIIPHIQAKSISIDLPGHGDSKKSPVGTITDIAKRIVQLISVVSDGDYEIVGHSMGGYVALEVIKQDPNCKRITLMNSNFWTDSAQKKTDRLRTCEVVRKNKPLFIKEVIPNLFSKAPRSVIDALIQEANEIDSDVIIESSLAMINRPNNSELAINLKNELTLIQGIDDRVMDVELMRNQREKLNANYIEVPGGHMSWYEARKEVIQILNKKNGNLSFRYH